MWLRRVTAAAARPRASLRSQTSHGAWSGGEHRLLPLRPELIPTRPRHSAALRGTSSWTTRRTQVSDD
eukprot:10974538-Alexandrium_andersonii.AAC.1